MKVTLLDHTVIMEETEKWDQLEYNINDDNDDDESEEESKEESKSSNESKE